ncbi:MFS general substrate transporter [Marasmius fiardii PR-910]|nr:MFS general substrate transporter [Marasmius fiardii PR-910]
MLCAGFVAFVTFWTVEKYAKMPVAPTRLFVTWKSRNVPIALVIRILLFFHIFATIFYLPVFLQVTGHSTLLSSCLVIPFLILAASTSIVTNELCRIYGHARLLLIGGHLLLPIGLGLMSSLNETSSIGKIVGYSFIAGAGFGSGTQISLVIVQAGVPVDELSTVTALNGCMPNLGGTLGVAVVGAVISNVFKDIIFSSDVITASQVPLNTNDPVSTVRLFPIGSAASMAVIKAYVSAWQKGYWTLLGVSGLQILLCLFLGKVELSSGTPSKDGGQGNELQVEDKKALV